MFHHMLRLFLPKHWRIRQLGDYCSSKELEERIQVILTDIEESYDLRTFSLDTFAQWVEKRRNRPVEFVALRFPSTVSGGWLQLAEKDYVFYEEDALPLYQVHIQLHELSHMLCSHRPINSAKATDVESLSQLQDYLSGLHENPEKYDEAIGPLMLRSHRSEPEEIEAETLSERILERVSARQFEAMLTQPVTFSKMAVDAYEAMRMA